MKISQISAYTLAALVCAAPAWAANTVTSGQLANGLHYYVMNTPAETGRIDVRLQVGVGASDEDGSSEIGVAHMVEHMVFRRAPAYPNGVGDTLIGQGWRRGANFNAMTNYERTLYMFSPNQGVKQLDETLKALAAMVSPHEFSAEDWAKEQQVIEAEWRNGLGLNERMTRQRTAAIRSGSRQARYAIIGTQESIRQTPVSVLQAFHALWYVPNNMKLMISGDVQPAQVKPLIEKYFGALQTAQLPNRSGDYYEPKLVDGWHTAQLQDRDAGASQVAIIFRLDDSPVRDYQSAAGRKARLVARLAERVLAQRLRNQQRGFPKEVSNVSLRKADIGRHTVGVGLFASVSPNGHQQGLLELLKLRAQLLQQPVSARELAEQKQALQAAGQKALSRNTLPEPFGDAIQTVSENVFDDKPLRTPAQNAKLVLPVLATVSANDVNAQIRQWLNAADKLVQLQAPSLTKIEMPTVAQLQTWDAAAMQRKQPALLAAVAQGTGHFVDKPTAGKIVAQSDDANTKVSRWTLQNGDRVVVLQNPIAGDKLYWQAIGNAGFMQPEQNPWQTQLASQIVEQSAPQGWTSESLGAWRKNQQISVGNDALATQSKWSGNVPYRNAKSLWQLYHAYLATPQIGEDYRDAIVAMSRQIATQAQSSRSVQDNATIALRFGERAYPVPDQEELLETDEPQLLQQWRQLNRAHVTHYVLTAQPAQKLKPLVEQYLAGIERADVAPSKTHWAQAGSKVERLAINPEARANVSMWAFSSADWQPAQAAQVAALRTLAYERLKAKLRDQALGVYSLKFETTFNAQSGRIESELHFATTPELAEKLWQLGEQTLQELPDTITEAEVAQMRQQMQEQEVARLKSPETWLNRLILSETYLGDARYLQTMAQLPDSFTLDNVRQTARLLWNTQNRRVLIADPEQTGAAKSTR